MTAARIAAIMDGMPLPLGSTRMEPAHWIDDLAWHRQVYKQSKFRWDGTEALLVATEFTGGCQEFRTVADLRDLEGYRLALSEYTMTCQRALGLALQEARYGLGSGHWEDIATLLDLTAVDCAASSYFARWGDPRVAGQFSNPQVLRIRKMCAGFFFASPLLLAWELSQLWKLYRAAEELLEDTLVDLVVELQPLVRTSDLLHALHTTTEVGLNNRISSQRHERGPSGDPRRVPRQTFSPLTN
ncbi:hypothetical protein ATN37_02170 [Rhodococcus sp. MH15]|nr:hypothetical protein N601_29845 [Rhodococcus erythropolis DN1]MBW0288767.1 hypothetical protein [Rhodococcus sp. MH15]